MTGLLHRPASRWRPQLSNATMAVALASALLVVTFAPRAAAAALSISMSASPADHVAPGGTVTFRATVVMPDGSAGSGHVLFLNDPPPALTCDAASTNLSSGDATSVIGGAAVNLTSGTASVSTRALSIGGHTIEACYPHQGGGSATGSTFQEYSVTLPHAACLVNAPLIGPWGGTLSLGGPSSGGTRDRTFTVGEGVTAIRVTAQGAGGNQQAPTRQGRGARISATLPVTPGETLEIGHISGSMGAAYVARPNDGGCPATDADGTRFFIPKILLIAAAGGGQGESPWEHFLDRMAGRCGSSDAPQYGGQGGDADLGLGAGAGQPGCMNTTHDGGGGSGASVADGGAGGVGAPNTAEPNFCRSGARGSDGGFLIGPPGGGGGPANAVAGVGCPDDALNGGPGGAGFLGGGAGGGAGNTYSSNGPVKPGSGGGGGGGLSYI